MRNLLAAHLAAHAGPVSPSGLLGFNRGTQWSVGVLPQDPMHGIVACLDLGISCSAALAQTR
eukprot:6679092-Pyramimonas_sp.AAC.1